MAPIDDQYYRVLFMAARCMRLARDAALTGEPQSRGLLSRRRKRPVAQPALLAPPQSSRLD